MRWGLAVLLLAAVPLASAEDLTITSHDGTQLNARLYRPAEASAPAPAILLTHGWGESIESGTTKAFAQRYQELGYVVLAYDSRGFGRSGGEVELDGPNEVADVQTLIDHLASLDGVLLDGPGDPRLGMVGQSYAGGIQILAATEDPRIDAIAPFATWGNLLTSLAPDDVLKRGWIDLLFASGSTSSRGVPLGSTDPGAYDPDPTGGTTPKLAEWYATANAMNEPSAEMRQEVGVVRSLQPGMLDTPTFLAQGWPDTLFTPDHALATYTDLRMRGVDVRLALFHAGHGGFGAYATTEPVMAALDDFMRQHLLGEDPQMPPYPVLRYRYASDDFVGELQWPPAGSVYRPFYLTDDGLADAAGTLSQQLVAPVVPTQCTEISNFQSQSGGMCGHDVEGTRLDLRTPPLDAAVEVTGTPWLSLQASSTQQEMFLFFHLEDVAPDGTAKPVLSQVMPVRQASGPVLTPLATVTHRFEAGHRIALTVTTTDVNFHGAREPGQVTLGDAGDLLLLPLVPDDAWGDRVAPAITDVPMLPDDVLRLRVRDTMGVANLTLEAPDRIDARMSVEGTLHDRLVDVRLSGPCGNHTLRLTAADLAGNEQVHEAQVLPCRPTIELVESHKKESPLQVVPLLAAAAGAAAWSRRRG